MFLIAVSSDRDNSGFDAAHRPRLDVDVCSRLFCCLPLTKGWAETHCFITLTEAPPMDLRAELARLQIPRYVVAGRAGIDPAKLGHLINGTRQLTIELSERIRSALNAIALERIQDSP